MSPPPQVPPHVDEKPSCEGDAATGVFFKEVGGRVDGTDLESLNFGVEVENLGEVFGLSSELLVTALEVLKGPKSQETVPKYTMCGRTWGMKCGFLGTDLVQRDLVHLFLPLRYLARCRWTSGPEREPYEQR